VTTQPPGNPGWFKSAGGLGYLLAQQLVAAGETVVDVPATLASRVRVLSTGRSNKNDPNDTLSVALSALRFSGLRTVEAVGHAEVLRLLTKRNTDLGSQRCRVVCRLHALAAELAPGGIAKEINASDVDGLLDLLRPTTPVEQVRYDLVVELLDDIRRLDSQLKVSHKRIRNAVEASGTSLTGLYGVGPIIAGMLIGCSGDIARFANRDSYAAYNGTAPVEFSSGGRTVHRLSQRGNRQLNHPAHGGHHPAPPARYRGPDLFRPASERRQNKPRGHPGPETANQQRRLPVPRRRFPPSTDVAGPGGQTGATPKPARPALHP
jgi:transposase